KEKTAQLGPIVGTKSVAQKVAASSKPFVQKTKSQLLTKPNSPERIGAGKLPTANPKPLRKGQLIKEQKAITVEWDLSSKDKIQKDRARILSEIEKKAEVKKKNQLKMDM